jgi:hypothetical protein
VLDVVVREQRIHPFRMADPGEPGAEPVAMATTSAPGS